MNKFRVAVQLFAFCAAIFSLLAGNAIAEDKDDSPKVFTIGSKAPDLDIEHWISDNDGAFSHTTALKSDQVYVIEFWATWCGPCISAMPHIAELQKEHGDAVQVISVSDEDMGTIDTFLKREVGEDGKTFADLTKTYCLTTDPDESVKNDYFRAAGRTGIPCAFIVGKTGLVEWVGHPMGMDEPLQQVVDDEWDREKFAVKFKEEQERAAIEAKKRAKVVAVQRKLRSLFSEEKFAEGVEYLDTLLADDDYKEIHSNLKSARLQAVVFADLDGAAAELNTFCEENADKPAGLMAMAASVYQQHNRKPLSDGVLKAGLKCAEGALAARPENPDLMFLHARLIYIAEKDLDKAIELTEKSIENSTSRKAPKEAFLKQLQEEKEPADDDDEKEEADDK